jgi:hypothetical protein
MDMNTVLCTSQASLPLVGQSHLMMELSPTEASAVSGAMRTEGVVALFLVGAAIGGFLGASAGAAATLPAGGTGALPGAVLGAALGAAAGLGVAWWWG